MGGGARLVRPRWWQGFRTAVRKEYDKRRYQHNERGGVFAANILTAVLVGVGGAWALAVRAWWVGAVAIVWALLQLGLTSLLRQRTPLGAVRAAEWDAVERFLRDFSELEEAPPGHLVLWERYLVYAVALGVSARLVEAMALRIPEIADASHAGRWYVASPGRGRGIGGLGTFGCRLLEQLRRRVHAQVERLGLRRRVLRRRWRWRRWRWRRRHRCRVMPAGSGTAPGVRPA